MKSLDAGPVQCKGCHDAAEQKKIKVVKEIPRLKRNQPNTVLLATWMASDGVDEKLMAKQMNPVAFNHLEHEKRIDNCRVCHHETLNRCGTCHTEKGIEKGGYVPLSRSMHARDSERSCLGCHQQTQQEKNCAGCHALIPNKQFAEIQCSRCHAVEKTGLMPLPVQKERGELIAWHSIQNRSVDFKMVPDVDIPEKVTIDVMKDKYEAAVLPHRKIIRKLTAQIKDSPMAAVFHGEGKTLCQACHHNSPANVTPPKCSSCHGQSFKTVSEDRPDLMGAYHGQCITCHQVMEINKPAATDCVGCHKKKK